jgi:hypothetical protein
VNNEASDLFVNSFSIDRPIVLNSRQFEQISTDSEVL